MRRLVGRALPSGAEHYLEAVTADLLAAAAGDLHRVAKERWTGRNR